MLQGRSSEESVLPQSKSATVSAIHSLSFLAEEVCDYFLHEFGLISGAPYFVLLEIQRYSQGRVNLICNRRLPICYWTGYPWNRAICAHHIGESIHITQFFRINT